MDIEVDSNDVIKIVLQFLKENNLHKSMVALQEETNVSLNVVDNLDKLLSDIINGKWNRVLETVSSISISNEILFDLFEQIFFELIEMNEIDSARNLLYNSYPLQSMKIDEIHNMRYSRLQQILLNHDNNNNKNKKTNNKDKDKRRREIAENIEKQLFESSPSRLLSLINDALKYQQLSGKLIKGQSYDLFKNYDDDENKNNNNKYGEDEKIIRKNTCIIPFSKNSLMTCIKFSPDGNLLVSGSNDGFIEIWDYDTGKLIEFGDGNHDDKLLLVHDENSSITNITFSIDSQLMASSCNNGTIKIWKVYSQKNIITFDKCHNGSITSISFNKDSTQILSSSIDKTLKIHGLKSQRLLKQFNGHKSFVNNCFYINNNESIISYSSDGIIKIWNTKTRNCIYTINNIENIPNNMKISKMILNPMNKKKEIYMILSNDKNYIIYLLNIKTFKLIKKIESEKLKKYLLNKKNVEEKHYFKDIVTSFYGNYLYVLGENEHILYCFNLLKRKRDLLSNAIKLHDSEVICIEHHPHRNIFASLSEDKTLKIWKA